MSSYEAPAKLNLSLLVSPPRDDGYHPLQSLVQTIEWCDELEAHLGEGADELDVEGDVDLEDNLVLKAIALARTEGNVPPLALKLVKQVPVAAGLGGGSSDAAAALLAAAEFGDIARSALPSMAAGLGADVSLFLVGGTVMMTGQGERIDSVRPASGFAVAVVVPDFGLTTAEVYARWDALEGPEGVAVPDERLPPPLRGLMPMRNDLLPAAISVEPLLGDFMADVTSVWTTMVCLTGSGSACFGYFPTLDEASDAARAVSHLSRVGRGVDLRPVGVVGRPDPE